MGPPIQSPAVLGLCSGVGGLELGVKGVFPGSRLLGLCEREGHAVSILLGRMEDSSLEPAPIFTGSLEEFPSHLFTGRVDLLTCGFPCQPFSGAARGRNNAHDLWHTIWGIIGEVRPGYVFCENVQEWPIRRAARCLTRLGYDCSYLSLSASDLGAPHRRQRWWLLAYPHSDGQPSGRLHVQAPVHSAAEQIAQWQAGPGELLGVDDGFPGRVDRLKRLGNAAIPAQASVALQLLLGTQ
jgi:DNA (cytosine-5)-methyltransferase 1